VKSTTNQGPGLIDIKTLIEGDEEPVQAQVGRITYEIELADSWYDDKKDRDIPDSSGIWLSQDGLNIDEADYAGQAQTRLYDRIKDRLYDRGNRPLRGVEVDGCLSIGIRTKDAPYWLAKLEEILLTDEVQELAQAVVETAANCTVPFRVAGLNGRIRIGPYTDQDGEPVEDRTIVWAAVTAYGPGSELRNRVEQLHAAIGTQVLTLIGDERTYYRSNYNSWTVAFAIPSEEDFAWIEKFQEAINTDQVRELAQEVFSMTTSVETAPEASR
jgi:hypothetical protein